MCGVLTFIQFYTLVIYRAMDAKLGRRIAAASHGSASAHCLGPLDGPSAGDLTVDVDPGPAVQPVNKDVGHGATPA
jgi:hypothetical protein